ncbi:MAG TPA: carbonic anhydrase family protein [Candidatus Angelobacter sp.]|nr:carbonic anhydrase family protein [Candidatus Angelobacter sp.]
MSPKARSLLIAFAVFFFSMIVVAAGACQAAQPPEEYKVQPGQHQHHGGPHHMNIPDTSGQKCEPKFTYTPGPTDPTHWPGLCTTGKMQSPIDITHGQRLPIPPVSFEYQPAELAVFNNCNQYQVELLFSDNYWLRVGKKPYFLTNIHFHEPAEYAVDGKRASMAIHLVHLSPESTFLVIEVPVVVGQENSVMKTILDRVPDPGQEKKFKDAEINAMDLLPADRDFYRVPGSLTTPGCNEGVTWFVMKNPIEMSAAQIAEYKKHYHDTARPLQPANNRPVAEPPLK